MSLEQLPDRHRSSDIWWVPLKIALIYLIIGGLWITISDYFTGVYIRSVSAMVNVEIIKGWLFILATSTMLYLLIRRSMSAIQRREREQREIRARLQSLIENLPFDFWATDASGRYVMENSFTLKHWGDIIGLRPEDIAVPSEIISKWLDNNNRVLRGEVVIEELQYPIDGQLRYFYNVVAPVCEGSEILGAVGVNIDISALRNAERILRQSEEIFRRRYEAISVGVIVRDPHGVATYANKAAGDILGVSPESLIGGNSHSEWNVISEDGTPVAEEDIPSAHTLRTGEPVRGVVLGFHNPVSGELIWLLLSSEPILDPEISELRECVVTFVDITERKIVEEAVQSNEMLLRMFVEHTPAAIAMFDNDMRYLVYSKRWLTDYNLGDRDITGLSHYEVFPEIPDRWKEIHQRVLKGAVERCDEDPFQRLDGTLDWVKWEVRPWRDARGQIGGMIMFTEVITERKKSEEALRRSEEKYRSLVDNIPDVVWTATADGAVTYISHNVLDIIGYTPEEVYSAGRNIWFDVIHTDDIERLRPSWEALFNRDEKFDEEFRVRRKDGVWIWIHDESTFTYERNGQRYADGVISDITDRKRAEEILVDSERRLADIINFLPDATFAIDKEGHVIAWNHATEELTHVKSDDILGKGDHEYSIPFYGSRRPMLVDLALEWDNLVSKQYVAIERDNETIMAEAFTGALKPGGAYIWGRATPLYDREGNVVGAIESVRDITDRKRSENELKERTELLQTIMDTIPQAVFWKDTRSIYQGGNKAFAEFSGVSEPSELSGKSDVDMPWRASAGEFQSSDRYVIDKNESLLHRIENVQFSDERELWVDISKVPLHDEHGRVVGLLGVYEDITERRREEQAIQVTNERLRALVQSSPLAIIVLDPAGNVRLWNQAAVRIFGWTEAETIGRPMPIVQPEERETFDKLLRLVIQGESLSNVEVRRLRKDRSLIDVSVSSAPLYDASGNVVGIMAVLADITERKRTEEELARRRELEFRIREEADVAKRQFYRGTILSVTGGKLNLVSKEEIDSLLTRYAEEIPFSNSSELASLRAAVEEYCADIGMPEDRTYELATAVGEAAANAVKHAGGGIAAVGVKGDRVQVCIKDHGPGMDTLVLPKATLMRGFSTKPSMGLGYSVILDSVDTVYLATDRTGTWVLMEKDVVEVREDIKLEALPDTW